MFSVLSAILLCKHKNVSNNLNMKNNFCSLQYLTIALLSSQLAMAAIGLGSIKPNNTCLSLSLIHI